MSAIISLRKNTTYIHDNNTQYAAISLTVFCTLYRLLVSVQLPKTRLIFTYVIQLLPTRQENHRLSDAVASAQIRLQIWFVSICMVTRLLFVDVTPHRLGHFNEHLSLLTLPSVHTEGAGSTPHVPPWSRTGDISPQRWTRTCAGCTPTGSP